MVAKERVKEERLVRIFAIISDQPSDDVAKEACRALIYYANTDADVIFENKGLDLLFSLISNESNTSGVISAAIWVVRNLSAQGLSQPHHASSHIRAD